ncbi:hypothetical protein A6R68_04321, partial [Neotoma lepida]
IAVKSLGLVLRLLASVKGDRVTSNPLRLHLGVGNNSSSNLLAADTADLEKQRLVSRPSWVWSVLFLITLCDHLCWWVLSALCLSCLAGYLVPILAPRIFSSSKWTTKEQQIFHDTCSNPVKTSAGLWKHFFLLKEEEPKMYLITTVLSLVRLL